MLFGESSFGHRFHSWPEHLVRERDRLSKDATNYSHHRHSDICQGIESWENSSCERSSRKLILRKRRRFSLGQPLNWMKCNFLSSVSGEQGSDFALKNSEAGYCSEVNLPPRAMGCVNDDRRNEFEISYCPGEEVRHDDHRIDEQGSCCGYRGHRHAVGHNCREKDQHDVEDELTKDESVLTGFDVKEAFCNGEDCEEDEERYDEEESSWASLLAGVGNCSEQCDENHDDDKRDSVRAGLQSGEACRFVPRGKDDEKDEEYGKDAAKQGNEEGSLCRSSHEIEADPDEQCGDDDDADENDEDNMEGEGLLPTQDDFKQDGKDCREEDNDEQGGFVYRGLDARFSGERARQRKNELLRKFPPPLTTLVRTCNLPCHMPWVLRRSYRSDGRLVIKQVKVQHHEFFRAVRSNGRLILHLVSHDQEKARADQAETFNAEVHETGGQDFHPNKEERTEVDEVHEEEVIKVGKDLIRKESAGKSSSTGKNHGKDMERLTIEVSKPWSPIVLNRAETAPRDSGQMQRPCFSHPASPHLQGRSSPIAMGSKGVGSPNAWSPRLLLNRGETALRDSGQMQRILFSHPTSPHLQGIPSPISMGSKGVESPAGSRCPPKSNPLFGRSLPTIRPILG